MTRSRSGSFYCPLEPAWAPLSISQKAQISTTLPPASAPALTERQQRRHTRNPSFRIGSDEFQQCKSPPQSQQHLSLSHRSETRPLFLTASSLSSTYGFGTNAAPSASKPTLPLRERHSYSPARPSPLCGEAVPKLAQPLSSSAIWTFNARGHGTHHQRTRSSANSSCSTLHRTVLKSAFMAGPMARKARMYGLRVAWCVFGDARVEMARDLFGRSSPSSGIVGGDTEVAEVHRAGSISVAMPIHEMAFEWEQPGPSARYSYLEIDQHDSESDSDSANSSDSDYDSVSEEETDSGESEDLDDDDEIHREVLAAYHQASLDSSPELGKHAQAADDDSHWEVLTFEG